MAAVVPFIDARRIVEEHARGLRPAEAEPV